MNLSELKPGDTAVIEQVGGAGAIRRRIIDMGITPEIEVKLIKVAPLGDPIQIKIRGYELSIRKTEAENIKVVRREKSINEWCIRCENKANTK